MYNNVISIVSFIAAVLILLSPFYFKRKHDIQSMSSLATMLGILGTFSGIFIGLMGFNVSDLPRSVPQLLEGLKTAFITSIAGMITSLLLKEVPTIYGIKTEDSSSGEEVVEMMVTLLAEIEKNQKEHFQKEYQQFLNIEKSLCGEGDTTLLTQLQKLRTTILDKHEELVKEFRNFTQTMAENNSKALIDALTQVMRDFNTKINEQFGDNFKHLNEAVGRMLQWQQEYAEQVEMMSEQLKIAVTTIQSSSEVLDTIVMKTEAFTTTAKSLEVLIKSIDQIREDLENHLKSFEELAVNARNAFPIIDEQLKRLTMELTKSVEKAIQDSKAIVNIQVESTKAVTLQLQELQKNLGNSFVEMVRTTNMNIERMMKENSERIAQQLRVLDEQLGEELNKALRTLGSQLASLSRKFVDDYTPLTERLSELLHLVEKLKRDNK